MTLKTSKKDKSPITNIIGDEMLVRIVSRLQTHTTQNGKQLYKLQQSQATRTNSRRIAAKYLISNHLFPCFHNAIYNTCNSLPFSQNFCSHNKSHMLPEDNSSVTVNKTQENYEDENPKTLDNENPQENPKILKQGNKKNLEHENPIPETLEKENSHPITHENENPKTIPKPTAVKNENQENLEQENPRVLEHEYSNSKTLENENPHPKILDNESPETIPKPKTPKDENPKTLETLDNEHTRTLKQGSPDCIGNESPKPSVEKNLMCPDAKTSKTLVSEDSETLENIEKVLISYKEEDLKEADEICKILIQHHNPSNPMEASMQLQGIRLNPRLVLQVLLRLRNASTIAMGFFIWAKEQASYSHTADTYNVIIDIMGKVKQFDVAWKLVVELGQHQQGAPLGSKTFGILIRRLSAAGNRSRAIMTFRDMPSFIEREPTKEEYDMLFYNLCKFRHIEEAVGFFKRKRHLFRPDAKTYTIFIYGCFRCNKPDMARKYLDEMIKNDLKPNVETYNIFLAHIFKGTRPYEKVDFEKMMSQSKGILEEMKLWGLSPDVSTYTILMHAFGRRLLVDRCFKLLAGMKQSGCKPNVAVYTALIRCLCALGRFKEAYIIIDEMQKDGVSPCDITYNYFLKYFVRFGRAHEAVKQYKEMKNMPYCKPSINTYNLMIRLFSMVDDMDVVFEIWNDLQQSRNGPDLISYTSLIRALCDRGRRKEACEYMIQMVERGIIPHPETNRRVFWGLEISDNVTDYVELSNKLGEEEQKMNREFKGYQFKPFQKERLHKNKRKKKVLYRL